MPWHGPLAIHELSSTVLLFRCQQALQQTLSAARGREKKAKIYEIKVLFAGPIETTKIHTCNAKNQSCGVLPHIPFHKDQPHSGPGLECAEPCCGTFLKKE